MLKKIAVIVHRLLTGRRLFDVLQAKAKTIPPPPQAKEQPKVEKVEEARSSRSRP